MTEEISLDAPAAETPLYTTPFLLLCLSHALFAGSFNMMLPELPSYLASMGGAQYEGLIIALFTITAGISRPFSGKLADTIGRLPVMYVGALVCVFCSLLYPQLYFVAGFLALRFFHGFSTGFKPTGTSAYVADIAPLYRRGEAMGILGICLSLGASASPPLGSWLAKTVSINAMFYASAVMALFSVIIIYNLPETLQNKQRFHWRLLKVGRGDIWDPRALPAGIVMLGCYISYGVILTLVPDLSDSLHIGNRGTFFTLFTLASVSTRFFAGKTSDRIGRVPVLIISAILIGIAMLVFAHITTWKGLYLGSILFGLGNGIFSPAINAWTVDLGDPMRRGRALATMYIALEIAIGGGAAIAGWYYADLIYRMPAIFYFAAATSFAAVLYLLWWRRSAKTTL
ncbi:MAG: MFS transporter [Lewinellaceae bacterium]|nr:MFS transporter [Lewinellaceae bacterium]